MENSATTNPLMYGTPQQIADRVFATFEFENHYFETVAYEALLLILELLRHLGMEPKFKDIYRCLTNDASLTELIAGKGVSESDVSEAWICLFGRTFPRTARKVVRIFKSA